MAEPLLLTELAAYEPQKEALLASAEGKFVLIHDDEVVDAFYEHEQEAINEGYRRFGNVPFLVKQVVSVEPPAVLISSPFAL